MRFRSHHLARLLAAIAICLQAFMPGMMAHASHQQHVDPSHLMCLQSPTLSEAEKAIIAELVSAMEPESKSPDKTGHDGHCALCAFSHAVPLPTPDFPILALRYERARMEPLYQAGIVHPPQGPPVGSTGPPQTL